ncbi:MAG: hypothetical protein AMJ63_01790 [Myxococcales bacterium SG8_38_1]|nr:MAG: hypothetical protein AMJ63_01790 [Myxococcales bacterium SG8_38_1]
MSFEAIFADKLQCDASALVMSRWVKMICASGYTAIKASMFQMCQGHFRTQRFADFCAFKILS